jgi:flotillin
MVPSASRRRKSAGIPPEPTRQVEAIQNLKIDKITVWDSGGGDGNGNGCRGTTADFLSSLIGSLPAMHELADQAGIEPPAVLGRVNDDGRERVAKTKEERGAPATG